MLSQCFRKVSWRQITEGHSCVINKSSSLIFAFHLRQFHWIIFRPMVDGVYVLSFFFFCLVSLLVSDCFSAISITSSPSNLFGVRFNFIFLGRSFCLIGDFFPWSLIDFKGWLVGFDWLISGPDYFPWMFSTVSRWFFIICFRIFILGGGI